MKLLFCKACQDLFNLAATERVCRCGETRGRYVDDLNAIYSGGPAVPIGIANGSLVQAISNRPPYGSGYRFDAFVIPITAPTFKKSRTTSTN